MKVQIAQSLESLDQLFSKTFKDFQEEDKESESMNLAQKVQTIEGWRKERAEYNEKLQ